MIGVLDDHVRLASSRWDEQVWAWLGRVRHENAIREASRTAPRRPQPSEAIPAPLTTPQKRLASRLRSRGKSVTEIANALIVPRYAVALFFKRRQQHRIPQRRSS